MIISPETAPRVRLAHLPTPFEAAPRLGARLGCRLWIKRDDCTGLALGGNKSRKLEFTLGAALAEGCDAVVTWGGWQSNHVRQTAAAAAKLGLAAHMVVAGRAPGRLEHYARSGNLLLDTLLGAELTAVKDEGEARERAVEAAMKGFRRAGRKPFFVPLGASDPTGALGYVESARETLAQAAVAGVTPRAFVVVTGSAGTHAGLLAGVRRCGSQAEVIGVSSSEPAAAKIAKVRAILDPLTVQLGMKALPESDLVVLDGYVGGGYAVPTTEANAAIRLAASLEGLVLDPVYTGKAMAALAGECAKGRFGPGDAVVFMHTGGSPALFVYDDAFWKGVAES